MTNAPPFNRWDRYWTWLEKISDPKNLGLHDSRNRIALRTSLTRSCQSHPPQSPLDRFLLEEYFMREPCAEVHVVFPWQASRLTSISR